MLCLQDHEPFFRSFVKQYATAGTEDQILLPPEGEALHISCVQGQHVIRHARVVLYDLGKRWSLHRDSARYVQDIFVFQR
jgi:hypothetical protein